MEEVKTIDIAKNFDDACKKGMPLEALSALHEMEKTGPSLVPIQTTVQSQLLDLVKNSFKTDTGTKQLKDCSKSIRQTLNQYGVSAQSVENLLPNPPSHDHFIILSSLISDPPDLP